MDTIKVPSNVEYVPHYIDDEDNYLTHHGVSGQKWGVKYGPPYPLDRQSASDRKVLKTVDSNKLAEGVTINDVIQSAKAAGEISAVRTSEKIRKNKLTAPAKGAAAGIVTGAIISTVATGGLPIALGGLVTAGSMAALGVAGSAISTAKSAIDELFFDNNKISASYIKAYNEIVEAYENVNN